MEVLTSDAAIDRPGQDRPALPSPRPIDTSPVKFRIITPDNLPKGDEWALFALMPEDYETMSRNMAEILRWVREADWQLRYYRGENDLNREER